VAALVASFPEIDLDAVTAAAQAGVDAIEVRFAGASDVRRLLQTTDRLNIPVGVSLSEDTDSSIAASAVEARADWIRLPFAAPISTMLWEKPARLLTVPFEIDLDLAEGLGGLALDAVVVDHAVDVQSELTYTDALRVRALSELMKKPLLLHAGPAIPPGAAATCEYLGADGLLVDVDGPRSVDALGAYLRALETHAERR
jgi:hypothetical protein